MWNNFPPPRVDSIWDLTIVTSRLFCAAYVSKLLTVPPPPVLSALSSYETLKKWETNARRDRARGPQIERERDREAFF